MSDVIFALQAAAGAASGPMPFIGLIGLSTSTTLLGGDVVVDADSNIYVNPTDNSSYRYIVKIDKDAQVEWTKRVGAGVKLLGFAQGNLWFKDNSSGTCVTLLNPDGTVATQRAFTGNNNPQYAGAVEYGDNVVCCASGMADSSNNTGGGSIRTTASDYTVTNSAYLSTSVQSIAMSKTTNSDNLIYAVGSVSGSSITKWYVSPTTGAFGGQISINDNTSSYAVYPRSIACDPNSTRNYTIWKRNADIATYSGKTCVTAMNGSSHVWTREYYKIADQIDTQTTAPVVLPDGNILFGVTGYNADNNFYLLWLNQSTGAVLFARRFYSTDGYRITPQNYGTGLGIDGDYFVLCVTCNVNGTGGTGYDALVARLPVDGSMTGSYVFGSKTIYYESTTYSSGAVSLTSRTNYTPSSVTVNNSSNSYSVVNSSISSNIIDL